MNRREVLRGAAALGAALCVPLTGAAEDLSREFTWPNLYLGPWDDKPMTYGWKCWIDGKKYGDFCWVNEEPNALMLEKLQEICRIQAARSYAAITGRDIDEVWAGQFGA